MAIPTLDLDDSAAGTGYSTMFVENGSAVAIADIDVTITDPDDTTLESAVITLTNRQAGDLLAVNGVLAGAGAITASSYNAGTGVLTLSGTASLALYEQALQQIVYSNTSEAPNVTPRSVSVVLSDTVSSGTAAFATISVTAVNDAPDNAVPGTQTTFEEVAKVFSAGNGNQISVSDADAGTSDIRVSLSVEHGTLSLSGTSGLSFTIGDGASDSSMIFTGSISGINSALNGLTYVGDADYNGVDTLAINTNDLGRSEGGAVGFEQEALDNISINVVAVNDAPAATLGTDPYSATENQTLDLKNTGLSVSDGDAGPDAILTVTLSVTDGTLDIASGTSGATVTDTGTSSVTIRGTLAQINALLNTDGSSEVSYINNNDAPPTSVTLTLAVNDGGNTGTVLAAAIVFDAPVANTAGVLSSAVATADVNGDGSLDLIVANAGGGNDDVDDSISVLLGNGDGTFQAQQTFATADGPTGIALGDLNGDSFVDVVVANGFDNSVGVLLGNGDGTFGSHASFATGVTADIGPFDVVLANLDGDGFLDAIVTNPQDLVTEEGSVSILLGDGAGGFGAASVVSLGAATEVGTRRTAAADFDGDGNTDLAVTTAFELGGRVNILLGTGTGGFGVPQKIAVDAAVDVVAADLDGDGLIDLVVSSAPPSAPGAVNVLMGNGNGTFDAAVSYAVGVEPRDISVVDVNLDGRLDIVSANFGNPGTASVLLGNGNGTFGAATTFSSGGIFASGVAAGDFDGNGQIDLAVSHAAGAAVAVLLDAMNDGTGSDTATINITAVNDAPSITTPAPISVNEDIAAALTGISFDDADAGSGTVTATFSVASGTLSAIGGAGVTVGGDADTITLSGTIADLNTFINDGKLFFKTAADATADVTLNVSIDDGGNTGSGGAQTADLALDLEVTALNDAPRISVQAGRPDIATANFVSDNVSVLLATGAGTFTSALQGLDGGLAPRDIAVADFNGDGRLDLVTANGGAVPGSFTVLLGDGRAGFTADERGNGGSITLASLAVGDVNGDGLVDVVAGDFTSDALTILLSDGNGGFNESFLNSFTVGVVVVPAVALGDLDGDGDLDIVNGTGGSVFIRLGNGDGTFEDPTSVATTGIGLEDLALGDVNGDGRLDIVTANQSSDTVSVLLGTGSGIAFTAFTVGTPADQPFAITTADINADGRLDLVTANQVSNDVTVMLGDGLGGFSNTSYPAGAGALVPNDVAVADMDGDGDLDIVTANLVSDNVSVLTNTGAGFTPGIPTATGFGPVALVVGNFDNAQVVDEDTDLVFSAATNNAITIGDVDSAAVSVELSVGWGTLTLAAGSGVTFTGGANGTDFVEFSGTLLQVNAALEGLVYRGLPDVEGDDALTVNVVDGPNATTTIVPITVTAVNDAPVFTPSGGRVTIDFAGCGCFGLGDDYAAALMFDANGNIIVVGEGGVFPDPDVLLVRLDANGRIDTTFGTDGRTQTDVLDLGGVTEGSFESIYDAALQGDKILVVGRTDALDIDSDLLVVRYNADGTLDTTFATAAFDGVAIVDFGSSDGEDDAEGIAVFDDGSFVVGGETNDASEDFAIAKFTLNGALDTSFSGDGLLTIDFGGNNDEIAAIAVRGTHILAAGESSGPLDDDFAIVRLDAATGVLDTSFSGDGKLTIDFDTDTGDADASDDTAHDMAFQSDGTIVLIGATNNGHPGSNDFAIARISSTGTVLTKTQLDFGGGFSDVAYAVAIDDLDRIVVGGFSEDPLSGRELAALARFNADGTLDTTFGVNGLVTTDFGDIFASIHDLRIDEDGNIVVAGDTFGFFPGDFIVARYDENGVIDPTFGTPLFREGGDPVVMQGAAIAFDADLDALGSYEGLTVTIQRSGTASGDDVFSATGVLEAIDDPSGTLTVDDGGLLGPLDVGTYTQAGGVLTLTFNQDAFPTVMQAVLRSIAYSNTSVAPPDHVDIEWKIEDNNAAVAGLQGSGGPLVTTVTTTVLIASVNDAPLFTGLDGTPAYTENGAAVVLDANVSVSDTELDARGDYDGASITLQRSGGANAQDQFSGAGLLGALTQGQAFTYNGTTRGTVTANAGGTLTLTFDATATQANVNDVLRSIAYSNASDAPDATAQIGWSFSDGGVAGAPGALTATGSTSVAITQVDDPAVAHDDALSTTENTALIGVSVLADNGSGADTDPDSALVVTHINGTASIGPTPFVLASGARVILLANGALAYDPNGVFDGLGVAGSGAPTSATDSFTYTLAGGSTATVTVTINGADGNDTIVGTPGDDQLDGGFGDDDIDGLGGQDGLEGRSGNDRLEGRSGNDTLSGGADADVLSGGDGDDVLYGDGGADTLYGDGGNDRLEGQAAGDLLDGGDGNDVLEGRGGDDTLKGRAGEDTLSGGAGADGLWGGTGADILSGGVDDDQLDGQDGDDRLEGDEGRDVLEGRAGHDVLDGGIGDDQLGGGDGDDTLRGGAGEGSDLMYGDDGNDRLDGQGGADVLNGGAGADVLEGRAGRDTLSGGSGDDELSGGGGDDTLRGDGGDDVLYGDDGNDVLAGGFGADRLNGGIGADRFYINGVNEGADTIVDFTRGRGNDTLDLRDVLSGFTPSSSFENFVQASGVAHTTISVNVDGLGNDFVAVATLQNVTMTSTLLVELVFDGNLLLR